MKKVAPNEKVTITVPDKDGNLLYATHIGDRCINFQLELTSEKGRRREIGTIYKRERIFDVKRKRDAHLHRKSNSYGFMYAIIKELKSFDRVRLWDEFGRYLIPKDVIMNEGSVMNFKNSADGESYELQYFLPLPRIETFKEAY